MIVAAVVAAGALTIFPSAPTVPQRLLRVTIRFAAPVDLTREPVFGLRVVPNIEIPAPFADPPIWNDEASQVTLLLDPSRQKLDLSNHLRTDFVLPANRDVDVTVNGRVVHQWHVRSGGCTPLTPQLWSMNTVHAGTLESLELRFPEPLDVLSANMLAIARPGPSSEDPKMLAGSVALIADEQVWRFTPADVWRIGDRLAVHPRVENLCGDEIGDAFDHRPSTQLQDFSLTHFYALPVKSAGPVSR